MNATSYWVNKGKYYGYPNCCIKEFCKDFDYRIAGGKLHSDVESVLDFKGFVPCLSCARKILQGKATLTSLITNRRCPYPYPYGELSEYIIGMKYNDDTVDILGVPRAVVRGGSLPLETYKKMAMQNKCNYVIPHPDGVRIIHYQHPEILHIICNSWVTDIT